MKTRRKFWKQGAIGSIVIYTIIFFAAIITLYPFWYVIINSLSDPLRVIRRDVVWWPIDFSLQSYETLLSQKDVFLAYYNTIWYTVVGTIVNITLTVMAAYALSVRTFCLRRQISMFVAITMFVSGGIIPSYIVVNKLGLYDSRWALIIPTAISAYNLIVARSFFESLPEELTESAHLDGANDFVILWKIIVPISKPIISVLIIFYAVGHWNDFFTALLYLNKDAYQPLQTILRNILLSNQAMAGTTGAGEGSYAQQFADQIKFAVIIVSTVPVLCIYPFIQKYFEKGVMIGAVKG